MEVRKRCGKLESEGKLWWEGGKNLESEDGLECGGKVRKRKDLEGEVKLESGENIEAERI